MNILNGIIAPNDQPLLVSFSPVDALANPIPGTWKTKEDTKWSVMPPGVLNVEPVAMGFQARLTPAVPGTTVSGTVIVYAAAEVDINDGQGYKPMTARTQVSLQPPGVIAGMGIFAVPGQNVVSYKTVG